MWCVFFGGFGIESYAKCGVGSARHYMEYSDPRICTVLELLGGGARNYIMLSNRN